MSTAGGRKSFSQVQQWYLNSTITQPDREGYRCGNGTCLGFVRGVGFTHVCDSSTSLLDMSQNETAHLASVFYLDADRVLNHAGGQTLLQITFSYVSKVQQDGCRATINTTICNFTAGIIEWPVSITNSELSLYLPDLLTINPPRMISVVEYSGDRLDAAVGTGVGPLAGLHNFVDNHFYDDATIKFNNDSNKWLYSGPGPGLLTDVFFSAEPVDHSNSTCDLSFPSPTEYVLGVMYDLMFRVAMRVGRDSERQSFSAEKAHSVLVFQSEWGYLAGALVVIGAGLCLVGSLIFWGNWRLESPVTLSPLETATLFVNHVQDADGEARGGGGGKNALLRRVLRPGARIDEILAEARRMDIRVGAEGREDRAGTGTSMSHVRSNISARETGRRSTWK